MENVIWLFEFRKLALVIQDFESAIADPGRSIELSYVFDLDVRIILKLKVVHPLCIGIEILRWWEEAPIWFLLFVDGELLEILDAGLYGRHWVMGGRFQSSSWWQCSVWSGLAGTWSGLISTRHGAVGGPVKDGACCRFGRASSGIVVAEGELVREMNGQLELEPEL